MPEMKFDIPKRKLAYILDSMSNQEIETLYTFLTGRFRTTETE